MKELTALDFIASIDIRRRNTNRKSVLKKCFQSTSLFKFDYTVYPVIGNLTSTCLTNNIQLSPEGG